MSATPKSASNPLIRASIDIIRGNSLHGWLHAYSRFAQPVLLVNGQAAKALDTASARPDVCAVLGLSPNEMPGFVFELSGVQPGDKLELWAATEAGCFLAATQTSGQYCSEDNLIAQISAAAKIAEAGDAVGIICPDGSNEGIIRAIDLYEIAAARHKAVLICSVDSSSSGEPFSLLQGLSGNIIAIKTQEKLLAKKLIESYRLFFRTIWLVNPDITSFQLASLLSRDETRYLLDTDAQKRLEQEGSVEAEYSFRLCDFLCAQIDIGTTSGLMPRQAGEYVIRPIPQRGMARQEQSETHFLLSYIDFGPPPSELAELARAIQLLNLAAPMPFRLAIHANGLSPQQREELGQLGASVHEQVEPGQVAAIVAESRVIIGAAHQRQCGGLVKQHLAALISAALANGKPIFLPETEAFSQLASLQGVYLFTEGNLGEQLLKAAKAKAALPPEFASDHIYGVFEEARSRAKPCPTIAGLNLQLPDTGPVEPAIVLVWKIQDAGIYGRRIDQLARALRKAFTACKISIVEFYGDADLELTDAATGREENFYNGREFECQYLLLKKNGLEKNGIIYQAFNMDDKARLSSEFKSFLARGKLLPESCLFILFPIIACFDMLADILRPYKKIIDIVDNEFGWTNTAQRRVDLMSQYFRAIRFASAIVFNSRNNYDFFAQLGFPIAGAQLIPNWYALPPGWQAARRSSADDKLHIFYSGNMNDRMDWRLLFALASLPGVCLHLAGNAERHRGKLHALIECGAIYHGILHEEQTLSWLAQMDACIVPHLQDHISLYMDPLKIRMYEALGLRVILPKWLTNPAYAYAYENLADCLALVKALPKHQPGTGQTVANPEAEKRYLELIRQQHPNLGQNEFATLGSLNPCHLPDANLRQ